MVYSLVDCVFTTEAERLGATVIPVSEAITKRQLMIMSDFASTAFMLHPVLLFVDCRGAEEDKVDLKSLP